ncbi:MAG: hypothetical protein M3092_01255 [Actinomycetia bacterium]|nr:hypothetical protein [Actinomycetes bacterium]
MTDGLTTIADAFAAATSEAAPENTGGAATTEPATEQAPVVAAEQPPVSSSPDGELQAVVNRLSEPATADPASPAVTNWDSTVPVSTVDGEQEVRLRDLRDGYMKGSDYTQKTQALAEDRKRLDQAEAFMKAYTDDPTEFARAIGEETGWLQPGQRPVKTIEGVKLPTDEDYETEVQRRLGQAMDESPEVRAGRAAEALREINLEFDSIGKKNGVDIPPQLRKSLMQEAVDRGVNDLEILFEARIARDRDRSRQTSELRSIAPSRPGQAPLAASGDGSAPPEITDIAGAWKAAVAEEATQ